MSISEDNLPPTGESTKPVSLLTGGPPTGRAELPEDLRAPWSWIDLGIFVLFAFGSIVVLTNFLGIVAMVWLGVGPAEIEKLATTNAAFVTLRQSLWFAMLMGYLFAVVRLRSHTPFWRTIGWRELPRRAISHSSAYLLWLAGGVVFAFIMQLASVLVGTKTRLPIEAFFQDRQSVLLLMAMGIVLAPAVEETIFRGYIYPVLARSFGITAGVVVTGMAFGLLHAPQLWGGWGQIGLLVFVGVVFTAVRARTGTVLSSYLLHLGYNAFLFLGFYIQTDGLRRLPVGS